VFAHGRVYQGDIAAPGDIAELTLTPDLQLRVYDMMNALLALGAGGGVRFSPVYFNAAYHDPDELSVTGLSDVPADVQWVGVLEWTTTGLNEWMQPEYHITYDVANARIQVAGAQFAAGSQFMAIYVTNQNAYDQVLNAIQQVQLNARVQDYIDSQLIADAETLDYTTNPFIVKAETSIGVYITWTTAADVGAYTLDIYAQAEDTDAGTTWHDVMTGDWEYQGTPAATIAQFASGLRISGVQATTYELLVRIDVNDINRLRLFFDETNQGTDGTLTASIVMMNR
jgi:hypothetical protein